MPAKSAGPQSGPPAGPGESGLAAPMTGTPLSQPAGSDSVAPDLHEEFEAISAILDRQDPSAREEARARIVRLFRRVDAGLGELGRLKEGIRSLVDRYKQLEVPGSADTRS